MGPWNSLVGGEHSTTLDLHPWKWTAWNTPENEHDIEKLYFFHRKYIFKCWMFWFSRVYPLSQALLTPGSCLSSSWPSDWPLDSSSCTGMETNTYSWTRGGVDGLGKQNNTWKSGRPCKFKTDTQKKWICKRDFLPPSMSLLGIFVEFPGCDHVYTVINVCCLIEFLIFSVLGD